MKLPLLLMSTILLSACGKPDGIADADYEKYKELAAPKILYACHAPPWVDPKEMEMCNQKYLGESKDPQKHLACVKDVFQNPQKVVTYGYAAGVGFAVTYNKLLADAQAECRGKLEVLESKS